MTKLLFFSILSNPPPGENVFISDKPWPEEVFENVLRNGSKDIFYRMVSVPTKEEVLKAFGERKEVFFKVQKLHHDGTWGPEEEEHFAPFGVHLSPDTITLTHPLYHAQWILETGVGIFGVIM